jgi:type I restriction enzyme, S subunit
MAGEWIETTIGEQATLQRGVDITKAEQRTGTVPVISSGGASSFHDTAAAAGPGVLLGRKGVVGSVYFIPSDYWPHDTTLWVKDFHGNDPRFVYYFFKWMAPRIATMDVGSANPTLNRNHVHPIEIRWPPLPEQRAIAHILATLDDKIELNRRMNETLEALARALFKSWFADFDPVRAMAEGRDPGLPQPLADIFPDSFEDSELGEIPRGWQCSTVGEQFKLTMGQSPPGNTYNESGNGLPFFQGRTDFGFRFPSPRVFCTAPTRLAEAGDTLVSVRAPVGDVNIAIERCAIGRGVAAVRHLTGSYSFTYHAMHHLGEYFGKFEGEGTVFGSINKADFEGIPFVAPPQTVIERFERIASSLDDRVKSNELAVRVVAALRDTLLPKLVSGTIRVKTVTENVEAVA